MSKKIIFRFGPKTTFKLDPGFFKLRPGWQAGLFDLAALITKLILPLFLLASFSLDLYSSVTGQAVVIALYAIVIIVLAMLIVRRILGRNENLPLVPYDLVLLFFTTSVAVSLFYHTAVAKDQANLWGGVSLKGISSICLIAYWFLYYLLLTYSANKKQLGLLIRMLFWSPLVMAVLTLVNYQIVPVTVELALCALIPGLTMLVLTQTKNRLILSLDLMICLAILLSNKNSIAIFSVLVTFISAFLALLIYKRNRLLLMIKALDNIKMSELRRDPLAVLNRHSQFVFFAIALLVSLGSLFWFSRNLSAEFFSGLTLGIKSLVPVDLTMILVGKGMQDSAGAKFFQLIYTQGVLPQLILLVFIFQFLRDGWRLIRSRIAVQIKSLLFFFGSSIFAFTVMLLLQNTSLELVMVLMVVFIAFTAQLKQIYLDKKETVVSGELNLLAGIKAVNTRFFLRLLQFSLALLVILAGLYLLSFLNYINIFIRQ